MKQSIASAVACAERAEIALIVANQYPGGDYFEFGSESFSSLKNFLTAFDLNGHPLRFPNTKFFAFDVFGEPQERPAMDDPERNYFAHYRAFGKSYYRLAERRLASHGLLLDRVVQVKGYFEDTLNEQFKAALRRENRRVGFAFLDCNMLASYKTCFDFLEEVMLEGRAFIYMDEYYQTDGVPELFEKFCASLTRRHGLVPRYIRNAGAYGALFMLQRSRP